ncbi:MAG: TonB-dependent receptor [Saprospiraceae bacterium]|nr:TonB-dependent receptor [Saprospiraceae bacterium]
MNYKGFHFPIQHRAVALVLALVFALNIQAQKAAPAALQSTENSNEIVGTILDRDTKLPLEFSTVSLFSKKDSSLLTGTTTIANGSFLLKTCHHDFFIKIEYLAYLPAYFGEAEPTARLELGVVELVPDVSRMAAVEVRATKSSVTMVLDKRVFNVGQDLTSAGGTAEDVLRNVPGISVDNDGRFSLRGSGTIRILLNGRGSSLVSDDNLSGLRQIRASQIERIEIITNPSARYEAEGMAGIVNIVLKTSQKKGLNSAVDAHFGNNDNMGLGATLNYSKGRFNGFFGTGIWYANRPGEGSFRNRFYDLGQPDSTVFSSMDRTHKRASLPGFVKFGADYYLNLQNIITTSLAYRRSNGENASDLTYEDAIGSVGNVYQITKRTEEEAEQESDLLYSLIYKRQFSKEGQQLIADFQFEEKSAEKTSVFGEQYFDGANNPLSGVDYLQLSGNEEGNRRLGGNLDYILPFGKDGKFEAGWQSSFRRISNNYEVREIVNNVENPDADFTNDFLYQEAIHGAYVNFGNSLKKLSYQTGLRVERSDVTTELLATNLTNPRQYADLFPSAFLAYKLSETDALQLSYSRRIQRPVYSDLNPFFTIRDRRNIFRGNPNIEPEYTNAYELGYIRYWEKASLSSVAYYRWTKNVIKRLQRIDADFPGVTITQAENLDFKRNYGVEFTYAYFPNPKWRLNGDVNLYHSLSKGSFLHEGKAVFVGGGSFTMESKASSRYSIKEKLHTQITLSYAAPRTTTQGLNRATTAFDLAVGVDFLKKNGTLTLSVNDLFNSRRRRSFSEDATFFSEDNFLWQSRTVLLSFHYRINQQKEPNRVYINPFVEENVEEY